MSNSTPSRPTRRWRNSTGRPIVTSTARATAANSGATATSAIAATTRSIAYLTASCQPTPSPSRRRISGSAPRCSTVVAAALDLVEARHDEHVDAELPAAADEAEHDVVRSRREGDHDVVDLLLVHDALEIPAGAEDREAADARRTGAARRGAAGPCRGTRPGACRARGSRACASPSGARPVRRRRSACVRRSPGARAAAARDRGRRAGPRTRVPSRRPTGGRSRRPSDRPGAARPRSPTVAATAELTRTRRSSSEAERRNGEA